MARRTGLLPFFVSLPLSFITHAMKSSLATLIALLCLSYIPTKGADIEYLFHNPPAGSRPIMIWQWMDGLVTAEAITSDLEAYKEAGIGGVQQFLVGGPMQTLISDTTNAIGTDNWRRLMRHAMEECARLGPDVRHPQLPRMVVERLPDGYSRAEHAATGVARHHHYR